MSAAGICLCFAGVALVPPKWGAGIAMSAAGTCSCFAGIALVPKNVAQASPCLLQAPAFVLQASRSYGKIGRRHLTPFGVFKI